MTPPDRSLLRLGLGSVTHNVSIMLGQAQPTLYAAVGYCFAIVILRLLVRRLWLADVIAATVTAFSLIGAFGDSPWQLAVALIVGAGNNYLLLQLLRRFGLLALFSYIVVAFPLRDAPLLVGTWFGGWALAIQSIPITVAAWALWVILSAQRRPGSETAA